MNNTKSLPKRKLINFLKNAVLDEDYSFPVDIPNDEAINFVHRMRVELSRFREKVKRSNRTPKSFKMLLIGSVKNGDNKCIITLRKSQSSHDVSNEIDEIFDTIAGGKQLDV